MAAMKPHGASAQDRAWARNLNKADGASQPKRKQNATFELSHSEAQALHIAALEYLRIHNVTICGELVTGKYEPASCVDSTARLAIRLDRYLLGGEHYNHRVSYGGQS